MTAFGIALKNGSVLAGMLGDETSNSLTLVGLDGSERVLLRTDVRSMKTTGRSLMPEGLEAVLDIQQMADLCAFLRK